MRRLRSRALGLLVAGALAAAFVGEAIDAQETAFLTALDASVTWAVSGETLTLADADGVPLVEAMRAMATPLG